MRLAILGCGSIGRRHLRNLQQLDYSELIAFDPAESARKEVIDEMGVEVADNLDDVWKWNPQVVLVCGPSNLHCELALEAVQRHCHLFLEKPLSHTLDGLGPLLSEVNRQRLTTMVGCNMRFHPGPRKVKSLIEEGAVGRVIAARIQTGSYLPRWRPLQDYRLSYSASPEWGGAVLDCIHEIDLALWYFGPAKVRGAACLPATCIGLETVGLAEMLLEHDCGSLSNVHLNFLQRDYRRTCQVIGTEGTIYWNFNDRRVLLLGPEGESLQEFSEPEGWQVNQMFIEEIQHFLEAIHCGRPTCNPISQSLAALKIALAVKSCFK